MSKIEAAGNPYDYNSKTGAANLKNWNTLVGSAASAETKAAQDEIEQTAKRTGLNSAATPYVTAELGRQKARDMSTARASQAVSDAQNAALWQQWLAQAKLGGAGVDSSLYGTSTSGRSNALQNLTQLGIASYGPINSLIGAVGQAAGTVGAAYCPAEGSLYLMADGTEKKVEDLKVGDQLAGIDDEPQTIEEIQSAYADTIHVVTENGKTTRNSLTHAFALPYGGFTVAAKSLGKVIKTVAGPSRVVRVEPAGRAKVFNVISDGSHTYRADGVWALGVGDAERHISMEVWDRVGRNLKQSACALAESY